MSDLLAGTIITGTDAPASGRDDDTTSQGSITSTSYAAGANVCGTTFVAPTTGRVLVIWRAGHIDNNTAGADTFLSVEVRQGSSIGSGTVELAAADDWAVQHEGVNEVGFGTAYPVERLTAGSTYNARTMHRVSAGTGTVDDREIIVIPLT